MVTGAATVHKKEVLTVVNSSGLKFTLTETPKAGAVMKVYKTLKGTDIGAEIPLTTGYTIASKVCTVVTGLVEGDKVIVDYYYTSTANTKSISITSDKFPGYYRLEGDTFWTNEDGGLIPAKYVMNKVKIKTDFKITQSADGDPSTFDFNMDVFPDDSKNMYTIQILEA